MYMLKGEVLSIKILIWIIHLIKRDTDGINRVLSKSTIRTKNRLYIFIINTLKSIYETV